MPDSRSPHYEVQDLGDGVHAAIARRDGTAVCNSGLVDLGEGTLVFDTGLTPDSAKDLRFVAERTFGRPASVAAISHWHFDHALGNQEFPGLPLWGTKRTREIFLERHDALAAELRRDELAKGVRELEELRERARSDAAREDADLFLGMNRALLAAADRLRLTPPRDTFETRLQLPGPKDAELLSFGAGHTEADAVLYLPHERLLCAGDLVVVGLQPSMGSGDPEHWLYVLDRLAELGAERVIPGHGPVVPAATGIEETRTYVGGVLEAAGAPVDAPLPQALRRWEGCLSLEANLQFTRAWLAKRPHPDRPGPSERDPAR